jgi:citrate synthase
VTTTIGEHRTIQPGLAGVTAFTTDIVEPDCEGGALRYRGVDVNELVDHQVGFGAVWSLLVDGQFGEPLPPATHLELPTTTRDTCADVQSALAALSGLWNLRPLLDIDDQARVTG